MRAIDKGLILCHTCGLLQKAIKSSEKRCGRCHSKIYFRKKESLLRSWIYLGLAIIFYIPANVLPILITEIPGQSSADTIMSGVAYFVSNGDWPLALIIFVASVLVPLLKIFSLIYLFTTVQLNHKKKKQKRTRLYRITEVVGRWSMVDVFVVALLVALVQLGAVATIRPGAGAAAFTLVVIFTLLAASSFDPRLIWDKK